MLKKLSLAALVAMGSMSVASATPLTDAIKGVSLNGFLRIRYYYDNISDANGQGNDESYNRWRTNAKLVFGVPVAENMKIVWRVHAQTNVYSKASTGNGDDNVPSNNGGKLADSLFFLNYANNGLIVNAGVVPLGVLPYASSDEFTTAHGTGVVGMYNAGDGLTVAAGWVDWLNNVYLADDRDALSTVDVTISPTSIDNDVYTAGVIYSNDQYGNIQLWDYTATDLIKNAFLATANLNVLKDYGVGVKLAFGTSKLDDAVDNNADNHNFWQVELNGNYAGVDALVGYAGTNDKDGVIVTSNDSKFGSIPMALINNVANMTDVDVWYGKLGYNVTDNANVYVSYASIDQAKDSNNLAKNNDSDEFNVGGSYKFNKKFGVSAYYANLDYSGDAEQNGYNDTEEIRVQFKYSF